MKMKLSSLLVAVVLLVLAVPAFAQFPDNFYLGGGIGSISFGGGEIGKEYEAGLLLTFSGEFENIFFDNFSIKSTLGYYLMGAKSDSDIKLTTYPWTLSAKYCLKDLLDLGPELSLYVGGGITDLPVYIRTSDDDVFVGGSNWGAHLLAGVDLKISDVLKGSFEISQHFITINKGIFKDEMVKFDNFVASFGLSYNLTPAAKEKPAEKPVEEVAPQPIVEPVQPEKPALSELEVILLQNRLNKINQQLAKEDIYISKLKEKLQTEKLTPVNREEATKILNYHESVVAKLNAEKAEILNKLK